MKVKNKTPRFFVPKIKGALPKNDGGLTPDKLSVLFTIVNRGKGDFYVDVIEGFGINLHVKVFGRGTAPSHVAELLGIGVQNKDVVISIVPENSVHKIIDNLNVKFSTVKKGNGIAFAVPMKSIIGVYVYNFLADNRVRKEN